MPEWLTRSERMGKLDQAPFGRRVKRTRLLAPEPLCQMRSHDAVHRNEARRLVRPVLIVVLLSTPALGALDDCPPPARETACWLWPGALPSRCGAAARIYLLQGHFHRDGGFEPQGPRAGRAPRAGREIVPVYRMDALPRNGALRHVALPDVRAWQQRGWNVPGLQIDFDSPTAQLGRYARWLAVENEDFRDNGDALGITSVTGLGDWLTTGQPTDLRALGHAAGTIAFMFYHRGRGIEPLAAYIEALGHSSLRFMVGLLPVQSADRQFERLRAAPGYRGAIVFHGLLPGSAPCTFCSDDGRGKRHVEAD